VRGHGDMPAIGGAGRTFTFSKAILSVDRSAYETATAPLPSLVGHTRRSSPTVFARRIASRIELQSGESRQSNRSMSVILRLFSSSTAALILRN
jgi:hypothetical protein